MIVKGLAERWQQVFGAIPIEEGAMMLHMLICFDLRPDVEIGAFGEALTDYTVHLKELDLVESNSPIGQRQSDTILDTDGERHHQHGQERDDVADEIRQGPPHQHRRLRHR